MPTTSRRRVALDSVPQLPDHLARDGNTASEAEADAVIKAACAALHGLREFREDKAGEVGTREFWVDRRFGMALVTEVS